MLKIYASTTDRIGSQLLYETIVLRARESGISGCTVYRGMMGYGSSSKITISKFWEITEKLPVIIEIVDSEEAIDGFFEVLEPLLQEMPKGCLVTRVPLDILIKKTGTVKNS